MKRVDLHVHSTFSDGTDTPTQLVRLAKETGLYAMALTDHDTIDGIDEAIKAGSEYGIEVVPGVELSTFYINKEIHIVGLYIDHTDESLKKELSASRNVRSERNKQICKKFNQLGYDISYDEMLTRYKDAVITRAHFADILVAKKIVGSRNEAFDRFLNPGKPCYVPRKKMDPKDAIKMIKNAGGVPILAHPVLYHLGNDAMNTLIKYLCESGIAGLEAIYSTYTQGDELKMRRIAKDNGLIISGGSDYHGKNKPSISLGTGRGHLCIPYEILDEIKKHATRFCH